MGVVGAVGIVHAVEGDGGLDSSDEEGEGTNERPESDVNAGVDAKDSEDGGDGSEGANGEFGVRVNQVGDLPVVGAEDIGGTVVVSGVRSVAEEVKTSSHHVANSDTEEGNVTKLGPVLNALLLLVSEILEVHEGRVHLASVGSFKVLGHFTVFNFLDYNSEPSPRLNILPCLIQLARSILNPTLG